MYLKGLKVYFWQGPRAMEGTKVGLDGVFQCLIDGPSFYYQWTNHVLFGSGGGPVQHLGQLIDFNINN